MRAQGTEHEARRVISLMRFTKMQGVGNDFVLVADAPGTDYRSLAVTLCERHIGVGADGLLVVGREPTLSMRMFNPDGTEDMCGNGLRCAGLWAHRAGWVTDRRFTFDTRVGPRAVDLIEADSVQGLLRVNMGAPLFAPHDIPFAGTERVVNYPLVIEGRKFLVTSLNTGSTHTVIFGREPDEATFAHFSPLIECHELFPERTSVLWATLTGWNTASVRIWERGAGETLGCGTGACAVGVAAQVRGLVGAKPIDVVSKGGSLRIGWVGEGQPVMMTGPAQFVFEGDFACGDE